MAGLIITIIACYLLYKFIFGFVIPIVIATKSVRGKMKDMDQRMSGFGSDTHSSDTSDHNYQKGKSSSSPSKGDYIDFEEIR